MTHNEQTARVVIVGAGICGLAAARELVRRGVRVRVLEARERVGGRLLSVGGRDLGATWFWPGETRVERLVGQLGIETHPQHLAGDGLLQTPNGVERLAGNPIDVPAYRFREGAQSLAQAIAEELPKGTVRLGQAVRAIRATSRGLEVRTESGRVPAEDVVLALPPALAVHELELSPPLPDTLSRLARATPVWMGTTAKVVANYEHPFWRDEGLAGAAVSYVGPIREVHDMSGPEGSPGALFGFAPLPPSASTTEGPPRLTEARILHQLGELFGPRAERPTDLHIREWPRDPFTVPRGVTPSSDYGLFGHSDYRRPALGGRLHWASTETASESPGHIEGALAAADRAVQAILARQILEKRGDDPAD